MLDAVEAIKEKMVLVCKVLQKQRVIDGYGHLTVRLADGRILSTPHMPPGKVALRDLIVIDAAQRRSVTIGWGVHAQVGVPVTLVTTVIAATWLWWRQALAAVS